MLKSLQTKCKTCFGGPRTILYGFWRKKKTHMSFFPLTLFVSYAKKMRHKALSNYPLLVLGKPHWKSCRVYSGIAQIAKCVVFWVWDPLCTLWSADKYWRRNWEEIETEREGKQPIWKASNLLKLEIRSFLLRTEIFCILFPYGKREICSSELIWKPKTVAN